MILQLIGSNRVHDLQNLCLLFFPLSNFSEEDGNRLTVRLGATEAQAVFECASGRFEATAPYQPSRFDGERLALKRAAYDALSAATGLHSPWAVSYTHLDVYKRQKSYSVFLCSQFNDYGYFQCGDGKTFKTLRAAGRNRIYGDVFWNASSGF